MAKHMKHTSQQSLASSGTVFGRAVRIGAEQVRQVKGTEIVPGDVLPSGLVLEVTRHENDVRLEMVGADVHYVDNDETVTVLAQVDREVLDGISVGTFMARWAGR